MATQKEISSVQKDQETFELTTSSGLTVTVREMLTKDMMQLEKLLDKKGTGKLESTLKLLEMLSVPPKEITYVELENVPARDMMQLAKQLNKVMGLEEEEDNE